MAMNSHRQKTYSTSYQPIAQREGGDTTSHGTSLNTDFQTFAGFTWKIWTKRSLRAGGNSSANVNVPSSMAAWISVTRSPGKGKWPDKMTYKQTPLQPMEESKSVD